MRRAAAVEDYGDREETEVELDVEGEGWVTADSRGTPAGATSAGADGFEEVPSISEAAAQGVHGLSLAPDAEGSTGDAEEDDDVPDIDDLEAEEEEEDAAALPLPGTASAGRAEDEGVLRTRTYDLLITYDKYYQVPRFWLIGYDESRQLLAPSAVLEDVSQEHARKTVTVEAHPHGNSAVQAASIHPCRHAAVMRRLSRVVARDGLFRVEQ